MRTLTITPPGGVEAVIFDETKTPLPDACADGFRPRRLRRLERQNLPRAALQFVADRLNAAAEWEFAVTHSFASVSDCQDFVGARATVLPGSGLLKIQTVAGGESFARFYASAFLDRAEVVREIGCTVIFKYRVVLNSTYSEQP